MVRNERSHRAAEDVAVEALGFIAGDPERMSRFLDLTGLTGDTIRQAAAEPGFFVAILDHLASDESLLLTFAANAGLPPNLVLAARDQLAGPNAMGLRDG